ncbi:tol-pal system protein YbgF [Pseudodesulfovibrio sp. JC047]|uniref:tol-pal system protein YbgF n=1 Tax=Pseudodesulfovibrio sp. JC047 TaxID=2683199 RepID=UPI0013D0F4D2|nr:tol-pal system protein YbgF [Pseudodesulfovibrio sp. JC047]NDV18772.1 tol-pal system protein YbgF [Pseudodesulfovibrio sp. JC047]
MVQLKLVSLLLVTLLFVGCTTTGKNAVTASASTEWRIKSLEEGFLNLREQQRTMANETAVANAAIEQQLADLESEIAALRAITPPVSSSVKSKEPVAEEAWATDLKPEDEGWVDGQKSTDKSAVQNDDEQPWATVPQAPVIVPEPKVVSRPVAKAAPKAAPKPVPSVTKKASGPKSLYALGLSQYNAEQFDASRATFDQFLQKYPNNTLAANALYWKGETYYSQKSYAQAILTFKEVTGRFSKHLKSASALLKIGMSYENVGDTENAVFYLRALVEDFPKSDAATLGRKALNRLGG